MKNRLLTMGQGRRSLAKGIRYLFLAAAGFVILLPILTLFSTSGKDLYGLVDPLVRWVPTTFRWDNYAKGFEVLGGGRTMLTSLWLFALIGVCQTLSSAVIAYGFAKYGFRGRSILFALMIATFFIPQQVSFLPRYVQYSQYKMLGTAWTLLLPALTGQGVKNALLILLFYQFFRLSPIAMEEAAMIDGASIPRIFLRVSLPLVTPALVASLVLSFAWNWNDTYFAGSYLVTANDSRLLTMSLSLQQVRDLYSAASGREVQIASVDEFFNQGIEAAAALMVILPLMILYILLEKKLIESVDRAGITGE